MFVNQNGLIIVPILLYLFLNVCESIHNQPLLHTKITFAYLLLTEQYLQILVGFHQLHLFPYDLESV